MNATSSGVREHPPGDRPAPPRIGRTGARRRQRSPAALRTWLASSAPRPRRGAPAGRSGARVRRGSFSLARHAAARPFIIDPTSRARRGVVPRRSPARSVPSRRLLGESENARDGRDDDCKYCGCFAIDSRRTSSCSLCHAHTHTIRQRTLRFTPDPVPGLSALIDDAQPVLQRPQSLMACTTAHPPPPAPPSRR